MPLSGLPRPEWLEPLSDPRNEAILSAAFDLFCEKGLHGTTMLDVATAAKVSKETLYARFDSKEGLFYALLAWGSERSRPKPDQFLDLSATDPRLALEEYAVHVLQMILRPEAIDVHRIMMGEAARMPEVAAVFFELTCTSKSKDFDLIRRRLIDSSLIRDIDSEAFAEIFIGLLRGNIHHSICLGVMPIPSAEDIRASALRAMDWLLRALAPAVEVHATRYGRLAASA